jgi:hypothetical protein
MYTFIYIHIYKCTYIHIYIYTYSSKCEETKDRCFFVKKEWKNQKSRCVDCMKVLNDAQKVYIYEYTYTCI